MYHREATGWREATVVKNAPASANGNARRLVRPAPAPAPPAPSPSRAGPPSLGFPAALARPPGGSGRRRGRAAGP